MMTVIIMMITQSSRHRGLQMELKSRFRVSIYMHIYDIYTPCNLFVNRDFSDVQNLFINRDCSDIQPASLKQGIINVLVF